jgi:outer membrane protein insertion porin family
MNFFDFRSLFQPAAVTLAATLMASMPAWAVDPFTVRDIRVEGLQRIEAGTVFASLPLRVGDQYSDEKGAAAIRALFALGLFKDIRLETQGDVLVVVVEERPSVAMVEFIGLKEFDKDVLIKALRDVGLAEGRPYDKAMADKIWVMGVMLELATEVFMAKRCSVFAKVSNRPICMVWAW